MNSLSIKPGDLEGAITIPPSKSQTLRAIFIASLAEGESLIEHPLESPDTHAMIKACLAFGAKIAIHSQQLVIQGVAGRPQFKPDTVIDAGNSGIVLRFITAIAALNETPVTITGDYSLQTRRPLKPLLAALRQLGARCETLVKADHAPVTVCGPVQAGTVSLNGQDSQPVSALLLLSALLPATMTLQVDQPGETPWIALTLTWLHRMNTTVQHNKYETLTVSQQRGFKGFNYRVPGDFSSLLFPVAAALITRCSIEIDGLDFQELQGDKHVLEILEQMGAPLAYDYQAGVLHIASHQGLIGIEVDLNPYIDALPILAVLACYANTPSCLTGAAIARLKESDRITAMQQELTKMGAIIQEREDGLMIKPGPLQGTAVYSHHDHRVTMALAVAALGAVGTTQIEASDCIAKTYANFVKDFQSLGADLEMQHEK